MNKEKTGIIEVMRENSKRIPKPFCNSLKCTGAVKVSKFGKLSKVGSDGTCESCGSHLIWVRKIERQRYGS